MRDEVCCCCIAVLPKEWLVLTKWVNLDHSVCNRPDDRGSLIYHTCDISIEIKIYFLEVKIWNTMTEGPQHSYVT